MVQNQKEHERDKRGIIVSAVDFGVMKKGEKKTITIYIKNAGMLSKCANKHEIGNGTGKSARTPNLS